MLGVSFFVSSAISIWEIAMLVKKKRISLNTTCHIWVNRVLSLPGVFLVPLSPDVAIETCELPGNFHGDPADRMIVATAKVENLYVISRDQKLIDYCTKHKINFLAG